MAWQLRDLPAGHERDLPPEEFAPIYPAVGNGK